MYDGTSYWGAKAGAGSSGSSGTSGGSGSSGTSGVSGSSGTSGIDGSSGTSGIDGSSGTSGGAGATGSSGTSGVNGSSGTSGSAGPTGATGDYNLPNSPKSVDYSATGGDEGTLIIFSSGSATNLTIPSNASYPFAVGTQLLITRGGVGEVGVTAASPVIINSTAGYLRLTSQYSGGSLVKTDTDTWYLFGDLKA